MAKKTAATRAAASKSTPGLGRSRRRQGEERADGGEQDQHALAALRADGGNQNHAEGEGAHNRAGGVGRVNAAHHSPGIAAARGHGRQRQRKTGAPQQRRRQDGPSRARQVDLEREPGAGGKQRVDGPIRQRVGEHVGGPCNRPGKQHLAPADGDARPGDAAHERRRHGAADPQARQEDRQNDGERVDRGAQKQPQQARPNHLGAQRARSRKRDGHIDRPGTRRAASTAGVAGGSSAPAWCGVREAMPKPIKATAPLMAAATRVAVAMSWTRSR